MPELPEVETVRAGLADHVLDQVITEVEFRHPRATRRSPGGEAALADATTGARITAIARRGKYLWCEFGNSDATLLIHLGMSGQILIDPRPGMPRHHLRARFAIGSHEVWFVDQRTFGHLMISESHETPDGQPAGWGSNQPRIPTAIWHIARDPLDSYADLPAIARAIRGRTTSIKRALLDQTVVSGIGNIYADESLFHARIHPRRATATMSQKQALKVLHEAREVMTQALAAGGTSFDVLYVDVAGRSGYFERELTVYGRAGLPCVRCARPIVRESFANRSSHRCPSCQRTPAPAHLAKC
ncbi:DNA-formamidopyrimidine glycosylase [Bowdeniella nasicola]|uniref:Formamidopyrimidine-DNA glycosylase n=1 Tax=Bowdeniella nasicola TaxID=208480 RepID=A0A1Q5Q4V6_9ACTO|nr:bifunctional DNA-formamidopyrimidine glycosylase/DNA-(apurinic or apyrimidinic site) lyase [Bowdeniella nasicola]OKL54660.1 DNA-formamidopyrimidine glycosylase [Bowdeniella nasicola]